MPQFSEYTRFGVIMAGGVGERFWPLSRKARPKQLLHLTNADRSMLGEALDRLAAVVPAERVYVITGTHLVEPIRAAEAGLPPKNVVGEPCKRNTSGALAYVTAHIMARHPDLEPDRITFAVTTADHHIGEEDAFARTLEAAIAAAEAEDALVTCGIVPASPETGFGYIHAGARLPIAEDVGVFEVQAFHEKPDIEVAEDFVRSGDYFWNSGMFFWKVSAFLRELGHARPGLARAVGEMAVALKNNEQGRAEAVFENLDDISIDYALMEHAQRVLMVRGAFPWGDIGSWPALQQLRGTDDLGNCSIGDPVLIDAEDCIVYNEPGIEKVAVGVVGVKGLAVVVTADGVLVLPKDQAQEVRKVVAELKRRQAGHL